MNNIPENGEYFYFRFDKFGGYEVRFYDNNFGYLKSIYNTEDTSYNIGYENCLRDIGYQEIPKLLQKAEEINLNNIKYYKTLFLGSDRWQISLYDADSRVIDDICCSNSDIMLGYTNCLNRLGYKED